MKIGRTEKCWLAAVFFFWVFYNLPGFTAYGNEKACIVQGLISFIGTVLSVYIGCKLTEKEYPLIEDEEQEEAAQKDTHPAAETERNR